jgi:hypothetical protein
MMALMYMVVLQKGKALSPRDFPQGGVLSIKPTGDGVVNLTVKGNSVDAERVLHSLKNSICFFQRIDSDQAVTRPHSFGPYDDAASSATRCISSRTGSKT